MADLDRINKTIIGPGLALLPSYMDSTEARQLLLTIGLQESAFRHRKQIGGPAVGYWQFELGGGVAGVLGHDSSETLAAAVCTERGIKPTASAVYAAMPTDDLLSCAFARLLLWTDAATLPASGFAGAAYDYYLRNWRPGAYTRGSAAERASLRKRWDTNYQLAFEALHA